jgi:hypothetical protein
VEVPDEEDPERLFDRPLEEVRLGQRSDHGRGG